MAGRCGRKPLFIIRRWSHRNHLSAASRGLTLPLPGAVCQGELSRIRVFGRRSPFPGLAAAVEAICISALVAAGLGLDCVAANPQHQLAGALAHCDPIQEGGAHAHGQGGRAFGEVVVVHVLQVVLEDAHAGQAA